MKSFGGKMIATGLIIILAGFGCGRRTHDTSEAIALSKAKTTPEEREKYLVEQANRLIDSKQFVEAIKTAKYVLSHLDSNSAAARNIIEKAQSEAKKLADQKLREVKGRPGNVGL